MKKFIDDHEGQIVAAIAIFVFLLIGGIEWYHVTHFVQSWNLPQGFPGMRLLLLALTTYCTFLTILYSMRVGVINRAKCEGMEPGPALFFSGLFLHLLIYLGGAWSVAHLIGTLCAGILNPLQVALPLGVLFGPAMLVLALLCLLPGSLGLGMVLVWAFKHFDAI